MLTQTGHMLSYPFTPPSMNTKAITRIIIPIRWFQFHRKPQISVARSYVEDWGAFFEVFRVVNEFKVINQVVCNKKINFLKLWSDHVYYARCHCHERLKKIPDWLKILIMMMKVVLEDIVTKKSDDPLSEPVLHIII